MVKIDLYEEKKKKLFSQLLLHNFLFFWVIYLHRYTQVLLRLKSFTLFPIVANRKICINRSKTLHTQLYSSKPVYISAEPKLNYCGRSVTHHKH